MINLNDIVQSAQGGQAVDNIAARFGLSPAQAQSAIEALLPAFQMGLQNKIQSGGIGSILGQLANPAHQQAYTDAGAAQAPQATQGGSSVLGDLFGHQASTEVAQQASAQSGVSAAVIQAMLPVLASLIMGGLFHQGQGGGLGAILSQVIGSLTGGQAQGSVPNQPTGTGQPGPAGQGGAQDGLGGLIGSVLGGLLGGASTQAASPGRTTSYPDDSGAVPETGPAGSSAGTLDELSRMFQAGTPAAPTHEANLATILGR